MKLSIIIVSWNVQNELLNCISSVEKNQPKCEYEVIVVDNASTDGSVEVIRKNFPTVQIIVNKENVGFSAANNQGIKGSKGQYLLLLNPDTILHPNSISVLVDFLDQNPDVGACGPRFLDEEGNRLHSLGGVPTFRSLLYSKTLFRHLGIFRSHHRAVTKEDYDYYKQTETDQLSGAAVLLRRAVVENIGLMDEDFFMYYEDIDLFLRIKKSGLKLVYLPESIVTHLGGRSTSQLALRKQMMLYESLFIFLEKHRGKVQTTLFKLIFKLGVLLRELVNIALRAIVLVCAVAFLDSRRIRKSLFQIRRSLSFLFCYSWKFLFQT